MSEFEVTPLPGPPEGLEEYQDLARILIFSVAASHGQQHAVSLFVSVVTSFLVGTMGETPAQAGEILRGFADQIPAAHDRAGKTDQ